MNLFELKPIRNLHKMLMPKFEASEKIGMVLFFKEIVQLVLVSTLACSFLQCLS